LIQAQEVCIENREITKKITTQQRALYVIAM